MEAAIPGARAKYEIAFEIQQALQSSLLQALDFDGPVKQCLHAIHGSGGRQGVHDALRMVVSYADKSGGRERVKNWPAYVNKLLRVYLGAASETSEPRHSDSSSTAPSESPCCAGRDLLADAAADGACQEDVDRSRQAEGRPAAASAVALPPWPLSPTHREPLSPAPLEPAPEEASPPAPPLPPPPPSEASPAEPAQPLSLAPASVVPAPMPLPTAAVAAPPVSAQERLDEAGSRRSEEGAPTQRLCCAVPVSMSQTAYLCQQAKRHPCDGERFLELLLGCMHSDMTLIRRLQQELVTAVEEACRSALGTQFCRLTLVGSTALSIETPGSDIDVVCFTNDFADAEGPQGAIEYFQRDRDLEALQNIHKALGELADWCPDETIISSSIYEARVPILHILWSLRSGSIAVDLSINQRRPVEHVRWFQHAAGALARTPPESPPAAASTLVTVARCIKWWMKQRQIPRYKEGGLPTLAWILLALHACSSQTSRRSCPAGERPTAAIVEGLANFFHHYSPVNSLHGTLRFGAEALASEFEPGPRCEASPWAQLHLVDPTCQGADLARELPPATQLLLAHELRRAGARLPPLCQVAPEGGYGQLKEVFEPALEDCNLLPSCVSEGLGALVLLGNPSAGVGRIEVAIVHYILPREGWQAPFLHRADRSSELHAQLLDVDERGGWKLQPGPSVLLCPCHFVCRVNLGESARRHVLDAESLERLRSMRGYLEELRPQPPPPAPPPGGAPSGRRQQHRHKKESRGGPAGVPEDGKHPKLQPERLPGAAGVAAAA